MYTLLAIDAHDGRLFYKEGEKVYFARAPFESLEKYKHHSSVQEAANALATLDFRKVDQPFDSLAALKAYAIAEYKNANARLGRTVGNATDEDARKFVLGMNEKQLVDFVKSLQKRVHKASDLAKYDRTLGYIKANPHFSKIPNTYWYLFQQEPIAGESLTSKSMGEWHTHVSGLIAKKTRRKKVQKDFDRLYSFIGGMHLGKAMRKSLQGAVLQSVHSVLQFENYAPAAELLVPFFQSNLREFTAIADSPKAYAQNESFQFGRVVDDVLSGLQSIAEANNIQFVRDYNEDEVVNVNYAKLRSILENVIIITADGKDYSKASHTISIRLTQSNKAKTIEIQDNGLPARKAFYDSILTGYAEAFMAADVPPVSRLALLPLSAMLKSVRGTMTTGKRNDGFVTTIQLPVAV